MVSDADARTRHNDATAEFEIRNLKPQYHLVRVEIGRLSAAIVAMFDGLDEDRKAEINAEMTADYTEA